MSELLNLSIDELLTTTRTVRQRLDLSRPVERTVVEECLRLGFQAPNGGNNQDWGWVVVDAAATKQPVADLYRQGLADHLARDHTGEPPLEQTPARERMAASVAYLVDRMQDVPVLVLPTIGLRHQQQQTSFALASTWGSILPAVWNFMLALRSRGLGSAWTTLHLYREHEMADLLGIPTQQQQVGLFPVAYTVGTGFRPADRSASESRIFWNRWASS